MLIRHDMATEIQILMLIAYPISFGILIGGFIQSIRSKRRCKKMLEETIEEVDKIINREWS